LVLTTGIPTGTRFLGLLNNAGHAPIFGALALIVSRLMPARGARSAAGGATAGIAPGARHYLAAFGITVTAGIAVELIQSRIGRGASVMDIVMDTVGAAAALCLAAAYQFRRGTLRLRAGLIGVALVAIAVVLAPLVEGALAYARRQAMFPVIAGFERRLDLYFIEGAGAEIQRTTLPMSWAGGQLLTALQVRLGRAENPGLRLNEPAPDWRGYRRLKLDLVNPGARPLQLMIRVHDIAHDQRHEDRFNLPFTLPASSRRVLDIPLQDIANAPDRRRLDLGRVAGVVLFERSQPAPVGATFYLHQIWLE